ncbi:MAG: hypothetical protein GC154_03260 [bacterium]|nr:hypothetical protein [bacterium]
MGWFSNSVEAGRKPGAIAILSSSRAATQTSGYTNHHNEMCLYLVKYKSRGEQKKADEFEKKGDVLCTHPATRDKENEIRWTNFSCFRCVIRLTIMQLQSCAASSNSLNFRRLSLIVPAPPIFEPGKSGAATVVESDITISGKRTNNTFILQIH